ncbi:hypothetical protein IP91_00832 [Pseudoduganella lurida]|uniref:Fimbrial assembly protein n=1 Tax=Pseudoduganella lurida TaxID=1036180 RepID=A0A562RL46_9BURK|nr:PilN domain-containing protein [Pseudoduganella lurida]TWI69759.1 hypothetical protein IP91_00832 [Pseudoduganella lurida]
MPDIDMIPRSYRDGLRVRRTVRHGAVALTVVVVAAAAGSATLRWRTATIERQADTLRAAATQAQSDQAREATVRDAHERRMQQDALLRTARRQGEIAAFAQALDTTLPADVWLTGIVVRRPAQAGPAPATIGAAQAAPATVPAVAAAPVSIVELAGQAAAYDGITTFLAQLGSAPGVAAVQLQSSGASPDASAIDFRAVVTLAWQDRP